MRRELVEQTDGKQCRHSALVIAEAESDIADGTCAGTGCDWFV